MTPFSGAASIDKSTRSNTAMTENRESITTIAQARAESPLRVRQEQS
jgi:hypothetical protein